MGGIQVVRPPKCGLKNSTEGLDVMITMVAVSRRTDVELAHSTKETKRSAGEGPFSESCAPPEGVLASEKHQKNAGTRLVTKADSLPLAATMVRTQKLVFSLIG
jgi:hypothetical protein